MAEPKMFGKLPSKAASSIEAYDLHFPDADIKYMQDLLRLSHIADPVYENSLPDGDRHLGLRHDWLLEAKRVWETDFNWQVVCVHSFRLLMSYQEGDRKSHQLLPQFSGPY